MEDPESDSELELIDLTGVDLDELASLPDTVLVGTLRRILSGLDEATDRFCGFESALP